MTPHVEHSRIFAELRVAETLALLDRPEPARAILEDMLVRLPQRPQSSIERARRLGWMAGVAAALGDARAGSWLDEAADCVEDRNDGDDVDGYQARFREEVQLARERVEQLRMSRLAPLGQRRAPRLAHRVPASSYRWDRYTPALAAAEVRARGGNLAEVGQVEGLLTLCREERARFASLTKEAEREAGRDAHTYLLRDLVILTAGAVGAVTSNDRRVATLAALPEHARAVPKRARAPWLRSDAIAAVARSLAREDRIDEGVALIAEMTGGPRIALAVDLAEALLRARRPIDARPLLEDPGKLLAPRLQIPPEQIPDEDARLEALRSRLLALSAEAL